MGQFAEIYLYFWETSSSPYLKLSKKQSMLKYNEKK